MNFGWLCISCRQPENTNPKKNIAARPSSPKRNLKSGLWSAAALGCGERFSPAQKSLHNVNPERVCAEPLIRHLRNLSRVKTLQKTLCIIQPELGVLRLN